MLRVRIPLLTVALALGSMASVEAGWHEFWDRVHLDFHRNNCWMEPFRSVDRHTARLPFDAMVSSGWRTQNTLSQHYFHPETQTLNDAGERKVYWIINNAPEQYRTLYVSQSHQSGIVERRMDSVQQTLARMLPDQPLPAVIAVVNDPQGRPAEYIDAIDRKVQASIPEPRLPAFQEAGSSGGGN